MRISNTNRKSPEKLFWLCLQQYHQAWFIFGQRQSLPDCVEQGGTQFRVKRQVKRVRDVYQQNEPRYLWDYNVGNIYLNLGL